MSSETPVLLPISTWSLELNRLLTASFIELEKSSIDKVTRVLWEKELLAKIAVDHLKFMPPIKTWLMRSLSMDVKALSDLEILQFFVGNQFWQKYNPEEAMKYLKQLQHIVDKMQFGTNQPQHHQLNFLEDITQHDFVAEENSVEFIEDSEKEEDDDSDYEEGFDSLSISSGPQSPPRKRQKQPKRTINRIQRTTSVNSSVSSVTFEAFNNMPILSNNQSTWNQTLEANPSFWELKCLSWKTLLDAAYELRKDTTLSQERNEEEYQNVVGVLREIRKVQRGIYSRAEWQEAVKSSQLAKSVKLWSSPYMLLHCKASFAVSLIRRNRITESLSLILYSWIPKEEVLTWMPLDKVPTFSLNGPRKLEGKELLQFFKEYPDVIPRQSYPSSVYFLLNLDNFIIVYKQWLAFALHEADQLKERDWYKYDLNALKQENEMQDLYSGLIRLLEQQIRSGHLTSYYESFDLSKTHSL
ncbi:hypothetical protein GALMADRAFT_146658 [Galerina marginata CBS 339.88]|uniref:Uncharacterized protein n=1 Tax=Galerina marginata (strain CBS 339.88) TaxID=685588 RepID=A0A067SAL3_GALM3|nr:hypothetical protein GALMADRAFT_146658 [Galerina marginata CBS 339.88]